MLDSVKLLRQMAQSATSSRQHKNELAKMRMRKMRDRKRKVLVVHLLPDKVSDVEDDMMDIEVPCMDTTFNVPEQQIVDSTAASINARPNIVTTKITIPPQVAVVYNIIRMATGMLGGNGITGPIYGEITVGSMQHILNFMKSNCGLTTASRFIDVGSGLGKPNFHAAQDPIVRLSVGVELERIRHQVLFPLFCLFGSVRSTILQLTFYLLHFCLFWF